MMAETRHTTVALLVLTLAGTGLSADTLVRRDGARMQGRLVTVRNGVIEFEEARDNRRQIVRIDLADVRAIEFDREEAPGSGPNRPRGLREREVLVPAHIAWTDSGVDLRPGQTVYFTAAGRVRWGPRRQDGPNGEGGSPRNPNRPMPTRPAAALIGRVGDDAPFFIGADEEGVRVRGAGRLHLGLNDDVLDDNTGEFRVTVYF